jgi:quinol monooxygenase YgiN
MIVVMGRIEVEEGEIVRLQSDLAKQMTATQQEDGCEHYVFSRDVTNLNRLILTECWRDADALAAHMKSPHMAEFNQAIGGAKVVSASVKEYEIANVRSLIGG